MKNNVVVCTKTNYPKLSKKLDKFINEENIHSVFYEMKENSLRRKCFKLLLSLLKEDYRFELANVLEQIDRMQFDIMANTGWSISEFGGCCVESNYELTNLSSVENHYENVLVTYKVIRGKSGYHISTESVGYKKSIEEGFLIYNKGKLEIIHELYNKRDNLIFNIENGLKDKENIFLANSLLEFLGYIPEDPFEYIDLDVKQRKRF